MIVEDSDDLRELYATWLREHGYDVHEAAEGRIAWERIVELEPDVVLLDLGLPNVDGWRLATYVRLANKPVTLIAITGRVDPDAVQEARDVGVDAVLLKPTDPQSILSAIETELARRTA